MFKTTEQKNGRYTTLLKDGYWYIVKLYDARGNLLDKMRCDTPRAAHEYYRAFNAIAKNG